MRFRLETNVMISGAVLPFDAAARSSSQPGLPDAFYTSFPMWPLIDTALHLIEDANLISARRYGIELDLESMWRAWIAAAADPAHDAVALRARMDALDCRLLDVLAHAWPDQRDPVVVALLHEADEMRDRLQAQACRILSGAHRRHASHHEPGHVEHGNGAAKIPDGHGHEAVGKVFLAFVEREPEMMEQWAGHREGERTRN